MVFGGGDLIDFLVRLAAAKKGSLRVLGIPSTEYESQQPMDELLGRRESR